MREFVFDPTDWYWKVGGSTTQVYSSSRGDYISASDPVYISWLALGNKPTAIDTEANLGTYLSGRSARPVPAAILDSYQGAQADGVLAQAVFKVLFNHENRIRVLEGKPQITAAQARAAIKALM